MSPLVETLLAKNERKRAEREERIAQAQAQFEAEEDKVILRRLDDVIMRARRYITETLDPERELLEQLRNTDEQIDTFQPRGREQWEEWYGRISAVEEDRYRTADQNRHRVWDRVYDSFFRRFQMAFTHRDDYVAPKCQVIGREGRVQFELGAPQFDHMGIGCCLPRADLLPDKLMEDLGLVTFVEGDKPLDRMRKKHEAIPAFKDTFRRVTPLDRESITLARQDEYAHHRMFVIRKPHDAPADAKGPTPQAVGNILAFSENIPGSRGEMGKRFKAGLYDVYGAYRRTHHERVQYEVEVGQLEEIRRKLEQLNHYLRKWKPDTPADEKETMADHAVTVLEECAEELRACEDVHKRAAHGRTDRHSELSVPERKEVTRKNVGACMARMIGAINDLEKRFQKMMRIGGFNEQDALFCRKEIEGGEKAMAAFRAQLTSKAEPVMRAANGALFENGHTGDLFAERQKDGIAGLVRRELNGERTPTQPVDELRKLHVAPFCTYAEAILRQYDQKLPAAIEARDGARFRSALITMHLIGKFEQVGECLEELRVNMMVPERFSFADARTAVHRVRAVFNECQILPEEQVGSLVAPYEEIQRELSRLEAGLAQHEGDALGEELREQIEKFLDNFNTEAIVRRFSETTETVSDTPQEGRNT